MAAADNGEQLTVQPQGFWKPRHAVSGLGVILLLVLAVRSCGGDEDETTAKSKAGEDTPRQAIVVQIPASQWPVPPAPRGQALSQPPVYGQPQPAAPTVDPENPWAVQRRPAYGYGNRNVQQPSQSTGWGQQRLQRPQYSQPPGTGQYRPLDDQADRARQNRTVAPAPAPVRPVAPYDRLSGSSFGSGGVNPYAGAYPGYYGAAPYMGPGAYGGWPGGYGYGYPGITGPGW